MSKMLLSNARLSFPSLWNRETYNGQDTGKYAATFLLPKDSKEGKELAKAITAAMKEIGCKADKTPLRDGDQVEYDGYEGNFAIKANTKKRPVVIDRHKSPITEDDDILFAGDFVNASIEIYTMDGTYGKRVGCQLNGVQFVKQGERFGGGGNAMDDFDTLDEVEEDEEDNPFG